MRQQTQMPGVGVMVVDSSTASSRWAARVYRRVSPTQWMGGGAVQ